MGASRPLQRPQPATAPPDRLRIRSLRLRARLRPESAGTSAPASSSSGSASPGCGISGCSAASRTGPFSLLPGGRAVPADRVLRPHRGQDLILAQRRPSTSAPGISPAAGGGADSTGITGGPERGDCRRGCCLGHDRGHSVGSISSLSTRLRRALARLRLCWADCLVRDRLVHVWPGWLS